MSFVYADGTVSYLWGLKHTEEGGEVSGVLGWRDGLVQQRLCQSRTTVLHILLIPAALFPPFSSPFPSFARPQLQTYSDRKDDSTFSLSASESNQVSFRSTPANLALMLLRPSPSPPPL